MEMRVVCMVKCAYEVFYMCIMKPDMTCLQMDRFGFETVHTDKGFIHYRWNLDVTHSQMDQFGFEAIHHTNRLQISPEL